MKILITGGAGFIGSNFAKLLLLHKSQTVSHVRVLDNLTYSGLRKNLEGVDSNDIEFIEGDICDFKVCSLATKGMDVIVHFAAESHVDRSIANPGVFVKTNVLGTSNLLEASLLNQNSTFLHVSTDEVYGSIEEGSWEECSPVAPNSPYAASKASSDLVALSFYKTFGLDVRITRSANNYGPNQFPEKIIPLYITNLIQGKDLPLYGNGENVREWLFVGDNCEGIYQTITRGRAGQIYNLGGERELRNIDLAKHLMLLFPESDSKITFVEDRKGHDYRYSLNTEKAERDLGFSPKTTFLEGISMTVDWYRNNHTWWRPLLGK